jgi:hypothetical protein
MIQRPPHHINVGTGLDRWRELYRSIMVLWLLASFSCLSSVQAANSDAFTSDIRYFTALGSRETGTHGAASAAEYILDRFKRLDLGETGIQSFEVPVIRYGEALLTVPATGKKLPIYPMDANAVSPPALAENALAGPLVYGAQGALSQLNGKPLHGAVVVLEMDSGKAWQQAASLGATSVIYVGREPQSKFRFSEKFELTPMTFPRFWVPAEALESAVGPLNALEKNLSVTVTARATWRPVDTENIYTLVPGKKPDLSEELIVVEAFYDTSAHVPGRAPGADEACGIATLLSMADYFKDHPPDRSILLLATGGHGQTLAGMREAIWSIRSSPKDLRQAARELEQEIERSGTILSALAPNHHPVSFFTPEGLATLSIPPVWEALTQEIKNRVDGISTQLMQLRLSQEEPGSRKRITDLAAERFFLRRLGWRTAFSDLSEKEKSELDRMLPETLKTIDAIRTAGRLQVERLKGAQSFRRIVKEREPVGFFSLHLSSHGDGIGAFNQGWLQALKPTINRTAAYARMDDMLKTGADNAAKNLDMESLFRDTLRPNRQYSWQSWFLDHPQLGGEVSSLAGFTGLTLATTLDARALWGTPFDTPEAMNIDFADIQSRFVAELIHQLAALPGLMAEEFPQDGFSTVTGRASFLRQGEIFPDQPAPGTVILAYQGATRYYAWVGPSGRFAIKGIADKKQVFDKLIIEGYRFDPEDGSVLWAMDKKRTGKEAYRLKIQNRSMETELIMFACRQSTLFDLLDPRSFRYLTKINLLDARIEASPMKYWWSRIDSRQSDIASIYLEPGTPYKLIFSDNVIQKKMILTHAAPGHPNGTGYRVDEWPSLTHTEYHAAHDMWSLLAPRIDNLEQHGIHDERIMGMRRSGESSLAAAKEALEGQRYDRFLALSSESWALASRVYDHVEKVQKDILFGVLFYVALFVPFAFCMERLLFSFTNIYHRIMAFGGVLLCLIAVIYRVHPAFQLAYSPLVVILAFFIIGLSFLVTLILFTKFEGEMSRLQRRSLGMAEGRINRWKAFTAAFFLGVTNLRRRRLRTALTCATLIILTFTIMSFTSVKSTRRHSQISFLPKAPYHGFLLKTVNWQDLPTESLDALEAAFAGEVMPRVWLQDPDQTRSMPTQVRKDAHSFEVQGMMGLSPQEPSLTGLDRILVGGRWLEKGKDREILLPESAAKALGIDPLNPESATVTLFGMPFTVSGVFSPERLEAQSDLDAEPLTPAVFPRETSAEMTEVEAEALESGEDVKTFQSRYQHIPAHLTAIISHRTLLSMGGRLKAVAAAGTLEGQGGKTENRAEQIADRFGLTLFAGTPKGVFLFHASDALTYSGMPNILIPIVISVFIVLNTMIGSVYERKREIAVYTSVGLAPSHVSFLFIAEAMAFAVISVVSGYLVAQVSASIFSGTRLWSGITVNYSSLAGVAAMALVMAVVLVSVIYPSRVAARIAIPDVNRSWVLPQAVENSLSVTLPFLMRDHEVTTVGNQLRDYFEGYRDISHGLFSTDDIRYEPPELATEPTPASREVPEDYCYWLTARVWLAPFDFGIVQRMTLSFCPSETEVGYFEIKVHLERESGEVHQWHRINRGFLHHLRRQLLAWRSVERQNSVAGSRMVSGEPEPIGQS